MEMVILNRKREGIVAKDRTWAPHRTALLSVWASIYVSTFVLFVSIRVPETGNETLRLALGSIALATLGLVFLRIEALRESLFGYFDWVAGRAKPNWIFALFIIILFAIAMTLLSI